MGKKKIAVIGLKGLPPFGGAANVGDNILEQLTDKYEFTIYSTASHTSHKGPYKGAKQIVFKKFPIRALNIFYYYIASAFHAVFKRRFDLVHLHQMDGAFILLLLRLRYPVIATSHGLPFKTGKWNKLLYPYFKINELFQARLSSHLTVVSRSLVAYYANLTSKDRITYIPNGINANEGQAISENLNSTSMEYHLPDNYILFAAGRIIPIKGLHFLLEALSFCEYRGKLIVLGDLTQQPGYQEKIMTLSANLDVEYRGLVREKDILNDYIRHARFFIFPSTQEAMSMMLLEVASLKIPIICSDIPENRDVFNPDEMIFFQSASSSDLADKIKWTLDNSGNLVSYTDNAYQSLIKNYQWSVIARQYERLFDEHVLKN